MSAGQRSNGAAPAACPPAADTSHAAPSARVAWDDLRIGESPREAKPDARCGLTAPGEEPTAASDDAPGVLPGAVLAGRYTLLERLGEGGMGEVWVASQSSPVRRKVALKLVKPGMDSRAVLARFAQERQALAMMDHPSIAKVLDAGMTAKARPFFVMELVDGVPLTRYCDEHRLALRERLELFVPVCKAVQHAHQKAIVHRDLKPSNILVAVYDSGPVPKVIDFGVAKATGGKLTDQTLATECGGTVGTLEYMAPEQAGLAGTRDVDTRADIYALGVVLYELLTGLRPFDSARLHDAAPEEAVRILREEDPPPPSTRLSGDHSLGSVAAGRQSEPKRLLGSLRGELDWVVMKCLAKDRNSRYETANGLARDIQRYLAHEPVSARPFSVRYRFGKFMRRYRGPVVAALLFLLGLIGGVIGTTWGYVRAEQRRDEAEAARDEAQRARAEAETAREGEVKAREVARHFWRKSQRRLSQARRAIDNLSGVFADLDPNSETKHDGSLRITLGKRLDKVAAQLNNEEVGNAHDAITVASLQDKLGCAQRNLGFPVKAIDLQARARATFNDRLGPAHRLTTEATNNLAVSYVHAEQVDKAVPLFEEALRHWKDRPGAPDRLVIQGNLGDAYASVGQLGKAIPMLKETLAGLTEKRGADNLHTLAVMLNLVRAYTVDGQSDEAVRLGIQALDLHTREFKPTHRQTLISMGRLADAYLAAGNLDDALPLYRQAWRTLEAELGPDNPDTLAAMTNLALAYEDAKQFDEAVGLLEQVRDICTKKLGPNDPETLGAMIRLACAYKAADRLDDAIWQLEQAKPASLTHLGPGHADTLKCLTNLAWSYWQHERFDDAFPLLEQVLAAQREKFGPGHRDTLVTMVNLATAYTLKGPADKAAPLYDECIDRLRNEPAAAGYVGLDQVLAVDVLDLFSAHHYVPAERLARARLALCEKSGADGWTTFRARLLLGGAFLGRHGQTHAAEWLIDLYDATGRTGEAAKWLIKPPTASRTAGVPFRP